MERVIGFDCTMSVQDMNFDIDFDSGSNGFDTSFSNLQVVTGETDYEKLKNKPSINDVTLIKNKTSDQLGLQDHMDTITNRDIEDILNLFV